MNHHDQKSVMSLKKMIHIDTRLWKFAGLEEVTWESRDKDGSDQKLADGHSLNVDRDSGIYNCFCSFEGACN